MERRRKKGEEHKKEIGEKIKKKIIYVCIGTHIHMCTYIYFLRIFSNSLYIKICTHIYLFISLFQLNHVVVIKIKRK